jgi:hypothetical protein
MSDKVVLFLSKDELITLGLVANIGFEAMIHQHSVANTHTISRLAKCGAIVQKLETECNEHLGSEIGVSDVGGAVGVSEASMAAAENTGGESDAR